MDARMPISLFAVSIVFGVFVAHRKQILVLSPYGVFLIFQVLYNVIPWLTASSDKSITLFSLLSNKHIINIQLLMAAFSNICFGLVYLIFYRDVRFETTCLRVSRRMRRNYILLAFLFFLATCALCEKYGWHQFTFAGYAAGSGETLGGMFTVTAYFKFFFVAVYLYYLYRFGLDAGAWILMGMHVIVMVIDGARATFVPVFLVTLFVLLDKSSNRARLKFIYILAFAGFLLSMVTRSLIFQDSNILQDVVIPVTVEGTMGDYSSLQSIQGVEELPNPQYTFGASYVLDPIVWLIPQSIGREGLASFAGWTNRLAPVINEDFAPMGGFYYMSEAVAAFSYVGPVIVTTAFAFALIWVERNKNTHRMLYYAWMSTMGLMFVKVPFGNGMKLFIIELLMMEILKLVKNVTMILPRKRKRRAAAFLSPKRANFQES